MLDIFYFPNNKPLSLTPSYCSVPVYFLIINGFKHLKSILNLKASKNKAIGINKKEKITRGKIFWGIRLCFKDCSIIYKYLYAHYMSGNLVSLFLKKQQ
jgi:hypothetical protein